MELTSVFTDFVVLILAGVLAGNAVGSATKEYSFGALKNTVAGGIGGCGGYFLRTLAPPTVDAAGNPTLDDSVINHMIILALIGLAAGGVLTLVLGFAKHEAPKHRSS